MSRISRGVTDIEGDGETQIGVTQWGDGGRWRCLDHPRDSEHPNEVVIRHGFVLGGGEHLQHVDDLWGSQS
jgi:hypothetical protein